MFCLVFWIAEKFPSSEGFAMLIKELKVIALIFRYLLVTVLAFIIKTQFLMVKFLIYTKPRKLHLAGTALYSFQVIILHYFYNISQE